MKRIFAILILGMLIFSACGEPKPILIEQGDFSYVKKLDVEVENPIGTVKSILSYMEITPEEFIDKVNSIASKDGKDAITCTDDGAFPTFSTQDGFVEFEFETNDKSGNILWIKIPVQSETMEEAKETGYYLDLVTEMLCPGYGKQVLDELGIFKQNKNVKEAYRTIQCGNVQFSYNAFTVFEIEAVEIEDEKNTNYAPVKP